jgi:hypothetical protein
MGSKSAFQAFGADGAKERDGIDVEFHTGEVTIIFRIARAGGSNSAFQQAAEKATRPYRRAGMTLEQLPPKLQDEITRKLYAEYIVLGWSTRYAADDTGAEVEVPHIFGDNDEPITFSPKAAVDVFKRVPDLLRFVIAEATNFQNFRIAARELEAKN